MKHKNSWCCISQCGACCYLEPEARTEAIEALSQTQIEIYLELVGNDGWCRHYNSGSRKCNIYETRPDFCQVKNLTKIFDIKKTKLNTIAVQCCKQHIRSVYGGKSLVMKKYKRSLYLQKSQP